MASTQKQTNRKIVAVNRKARHDYFVLETIEAGICLVGTEVKSIRQGNVNLKEAWVETENGELYVLGMHISPYEKGNIFNKDPLRKRKLLLHKSEIRNIEREKNVKGNTLIPLQLYFFKGKVKVELGICKGKKLYDKRETDAKRDAQRDIQRALKG